MTDQSRSLRAGYLLHDVSRLRRNVLDQAMRPHGITRAQWWILSNLYGSEREGIIQSDLARLLEISRVALGEAIDRLEASGYLRRVPDKVDRRANRLLITSEGREVVGKVQILSESIEEKILAGISLKDRTVLEKLLVRLKRNLQTLEGADEADEQIAVSKDELTATRRPKAAP